MTNDIQKDPQFAEFVTRVMDLAPEAPAYPEHVVAAPTPVRRKFAPWVWAPVTAVAVLLVVAPIALRSGDGGETTGLPFGSEQAVTDTVASDASTDPITGPGPVVPAVDDERNLLSLTPVVVAPGGRIVIDFAGANNVPRSELFWMDRFDYAEEQWFSEWILWSSRADGGPRFALAASTSVIVPPLNIVAEGDDTLLLPSDLPLGTYRVCVGVTDGSCGVFEISDGIPSPVDPSATPPDIPLVQVDVGQIQPEFGQVELDPVTLTLLVTPAQWLTGPDAVLVARADGYIGQDEDLPNGFYLRMNPEAEIVELEAVPGVQLTLVGIDEPAVFTLAEWAAMLDGPTGEAVTGIFVHLTYDVDGRVVMVTQQYVP